jgi:hypothetical protein
MPRRFNTAGPNVAERHYTLPALARLPDVRRFIEDGRTLRALGPPDHHQARRLRAIGGPAHGPG